MLTGMRSRMRVVLANSNPLVLSALAEAFENDARFSLAGTAATAEDFLVLARRVSVRLGVIEWTLPAMGGARLIEKLRTDCEDCPHIVAYGRESANAVRLAIMAGAAGFVPRSMGTDELLSSCANVAAGRMIFPYIDMRNLSHHPIFSLSQRERMILFALSRGLSNRELAKELSISLNTVKFHLSNLYEKLGVKNRAQAIAFFYASELSDMKIP